MYLVIVHSMGYPNTSTDPHFKTLLQKFSDIHVDWYSEPLYIPPSASPAVSLARLVNYLHPLPLKYFQANARCSISFLIISMCL